MNHESAKIKFSPSTVHMVSQCSYAQANANNYFNVLESLPLTKREISTLLARVYHSIIQVAFMSQ